MGTGGFLDVCLCLSCGGVGGVDEESVGDLGQGLEGGVMYVWVVSLDYMCRSMHMYIALGGYRRILGCCCLPTPMALASGGSPMFPLVVHQPASPSIWPAVQSLRRGLSTNPGATMWCICGCS